MKTKPIFALLALGGALAAAAVAADAYTSKGVGVATAVSGPVSLSRAAAVRPLKFRDDLLWRDVVETRKEAIARILFLGKSSVTVRELSRLEIREEPAPDGGDLYTLTLSAGKLRAAVERAFLGPRERIQVRTPNAVAGLRGTDLVVEIVAEPGQAGAWGLLASREGAVRLAQAPPAPRGTNVYTLAGEVDVANPLSPTGRVERIGPFEGTRVRGSLDPVRFRFTASDLRDILRGLHPPLPPPGERPAVSDSAKAKAQESAATETTRAGEQPGARGVGPGRGGGVDRRSITQSTITKTVRSVPPSPPTPPICQLGTCE